VQSLVSAIRRGDIDEMSFAFRAMRQEWNDDYTERIITEVRLFDVSAVTYPANPATLITARGSDEPRRGYPLSLALAEAEQFRLRRSA
jgi:HK97 family phage prohead protease